MKRRGPSIEPCGTPKKIFRSSLKLGFIPDPYAFNLAVSSCEIQSKACHRSVNTVAKTPLLSRIFRSFSIITQRQSCVPNSFLKPHWYLESLFQDNSKRIPRFLTILTKNSLNVLAISPSSWIIFVLLTKVILFFKFYRC